MNCWSRVGVKVYFLLLIRLKNRICAYNDCLPRSEQIFNEFVFSQVCVQVPVPVVVEAKQIECQKCQKYKVPVPKTKWVKQCNPVYDEKCSTEYHQHCKEETRCHTLYQTVCDNSGYEQVMFSKMALKIEWRAASTSFLLLKLFSYICTKGRWFLEISANSSTTTFQTLLKVLLW